MKRHLYVVLNFKLTSI